MSTIRVGENESVESALRRFKRKCSRDGIIGDLRKKEFYESPSVRDARRAKLQESAAATKLKNKILLNYQRNSVGFFIYHFCRIRG